MLDRRTFLATASAGFTAALSGCSAGGPLLGPTVRVAVPWSGMELNAFRSVLRGLGSLDYRVVPVPLGDDIATVFDLPESRRPDVVLLPQPGLVDKDQLAPLPDSITKPWPYADVWSELLVREGRLYGIPFKITHKSVVWYRKSVFDRFGLTPPQTWSEWLQHNDVLAKGGVAPLALAGADGWTLTDFFENVLAGLAPGVYKELARSGRERKPLHEAPEVATALGLLGRMWAAEDALAGGAAVSLVQQFADAVVEVFGHERAAMIVAPDFAEPVVREFARHSDDVGVFLFPKVDGDSDDSRPMPARGPLVVGGDVVVLSSPTSEHARDLVERLAELDAPRPWITGPGGFLAARVDTPPEWYSSEQLQKLADDLANPDRKGAIQFDLSDLLGAIGGSGGLWLVLQDFLAQVGGRGRADLSHQVERAMARLKELKELEG